MVRGRSEEIDVSDPGEAVLPLRAERRELQSAKRRRSFIIRTSYSSGDESSSAIS